MRTFKMLQIAVVIFGISALTSCGDSDGITSSGSSGISPRNNKNDPRVEETLPVPVPVIPTYRAQIKLDPKSSYTFQLSNTGFSKFTSIDVLSIEPSADRVAQDCGNISIRGDSNDDIYISCHSGGFNFKKVTIENVSSKYLVLDVTLLGLKARKNATGIHD